MMSSSWLRSLSTHGERDHNQNRAPQPRNAPTSAELDSFLAYSMLKLSPEHREIALEEINGIPQNNSEDQASLKVWLDDLDYYINDIKRGTACEVAELIDRQYVTSRDLRMMFLRSTRYDPQAAAERMIMFFDLKQSLFGQSKLIKKITLDDLNEDEINYLKSGAYQILPSTDSAGRKIVLVTPSLREFQSPDNELRARYYVLQCLTECQETQLTGITMVTHALAPYKNGYNEGLLWNFPIHHASIHLCVADHGLYYVQNSKCVYSLPKIMRSRMRIHYGSYKYIKDILSRFGIPGSHLPESAEIFPSKAYNDQWFEQRCRMEQDNDDAPSTMMKPNEFTDNDVLFGYGKRTHIGNMYFLNLIWAEIESYEAASRREKTLIAESIVGRVKLAGARFLKKNPVGGWEEVSDLGARGKIAKTFRNFRRYPGRS